MRTTDFLSLHKSSMCLNWMLVSLSPLLFKAGSWLLLLQISTMSPVSNFTYLLISTLPCHQYPHIYQTSLIPWYIMHSRKRWNLAHESPFLLRVQSFPIFNHPTVPCILLSNYLDHQLLLFRRFFTWFALLKSCQFSILCLQQCYKENDNAVNVLWAYRFMLMCWKDTVE